MDFKSILSVAKENKVYADQEIPIKRYSTEISAPKKPPKTLVKSNAVQAFLAKKKQEEEQKAIDAEIRRRELLDKRSEAKHNRKATTMAKRTKDNNFMANWQYNPNKDENEEKRRLKMLNPYASTSDSTPGTSRPRSSLHPDWNPSGSGVPRRDEPRKEPPPKPRLLPAPPVDFYDLLSLANKKQHQPILLPKIPKKPAQPTGDVQLQGRPMTNSEKRRFIEEQARLEGRSIATVTLPEHHPRTRFRLGADDDPNGEFVPNFHLAKQSLGVKTATAPTAPATGVTSKPTSDRPRPSSDRPRSTSDRPRPTSDRPHPTSDRPRPTAASAQRSSREGSASSSEVKPPRPGHESQRDSAQSRRPENGTAAPNSRPPPTNGRPVPKRPEQRSNGTGGAPTTTTSSSKPQSSSSVTVKRDVNSQLKSAPRSAPSVAPKSGANATSSRTPEATKSRPQVASTNGRVANKPAVSGRSQSEAQSRSGSSAVTSRPGTISGKPVSSSSTLNNRARPVTSSSTENGRSKAQPPVRPDSRPAPASSRTGSAGVGAGAPRPPAGQPSRSQPPSSSSNSRPASSSAPSTSGRQQLSTSRAPTASSNKQPTGRPPSDSTKQRPMAMKSVSSKQAPPASAQRGPGGSAPPPPKQFPPKDLAPKQFPPKDLAPKQFPPKDLAPKQFPPRDMLPKQFPPRDMIAKPLTQTLSRRGGPMRPAVAKRRIESDDEYDEEMDDFIDDGPVGNDTIDYSQHIREIFGYDRNRYANEAYDDIDRMESSFAQQMKEEAISTKLGIMEDMEDIQREQDELKRKKIACKRLKRK